MAIETLLFFMAILISAGSVLILRYALQKNRAAEQTLREAEQKYRQAREARLVSEQVLRRAESEHREAEHKLQQAHTELELAKVIGRQAQDKVRESNAERDATLAQVRLANERTQQAERARDEAIQAKNQVEVERNAAIRERDEARKYARDANERAIRAEELQRQAEHERDEALLRAQQAEYAREAMMRERDEAIRAKEQSERVCNAAIIRAQSAEQAKIQAELERDSALRERDQAIHARQVAEENMRQAIQARFDAEERARLANERAQQAEGERDAAIYARDQALREKQVAEEEARRANDRAQQSEDARDEAIKRAEKLEKERDDAREQARLAREAQSRAERRAKRAKHAFVEANKLRRAAIRRAEPAEQKRDADIEHREATIKEAKSPPATSTNAESPTPLPTLSNNEKITTDQPRSYQVVKRQAHIPIHPVEKRRGARSTEPQFHKTRNTRSPKPEIVCAQKQGEWILSVELPQDLLENYPHLQVLQNEMQLDGEEGRWQLNDAHGNLVVRSNEEIVWQIELGKRDEPRVFKLSGNLEQGQRVREITRGWYLLVVPDDWEHGGYSPQSVSIPGYHAFCRLVDDFHNIVFQSASHQNIPPLIPRATQFAMIGNRLTDADEKFGPLFGDTLPVIHADNPNIWHQVKAIVVGEEGRKREEWNSVVFSPDAQKADQELPPEIAEKIAQWTASWFFVRFYDENDQLMESMDFRLARGLQKIQVNPASALPTESGHSIVTIEFHHTPDCHIEPLSKVEIETDGGMTLAEIPPRVEYDQTKWRITTQGHDSVQVTILVERIWWATGTKDRAPLDSDWVAQPLALHRADFTAVSDKVLWLHLPHPRWADKAQVGFAQETQRPLPGKVTEQTVAIRLCHFCDSASLGQVGLARFVIWVDGFEATLAKVQVQAKCRYCDFVADSAADILSHVEQYHLNVLFQPLKYEEHRQRNPSLPHRIAICCKPGCNYYACSYSPLENVTSLIMEHIRRKKHYDEEGHPHFEELADVQKIRERLPKLIPDIRRCTISSCDWEKENPSKNELLQHLKEKHTHALYELC